MKTKDCVRFGLDNIIKNKKRIVLAILAMISALVLVSLISIYVEIGDYNEKMLRATLKNDMNNTKYIIINYINFIIIHYNCKVKKIECIKLFGMTIISGVNQSE